MPESVTKGEIIQNVPAEADEVYNKTGQNLKQPAIKSEQFFKN